MRDIDWVPAIRNKVGRSTEVCGWRGTGVHFIEQTAVHVTIPEPAQALEISTSAHILSC